MSILKNMMCLVLPVLLAACTGGGKLQTGIAEVSYDPPVGSDMVGNYRGDDYASRGVHDSLYARALVFRGSNGVKAAMLTVDICWMKRPAIDLMRGYIAANSDIPAQNVLIAATHTHSGPKSLLDAPYAEEYLLRAAGAVIEANRRLAPTTLFAGRVSEKRLSFSRRLKAVDGTTHMCWEKLPDGYVEDFLSHPDYDVLALGIERRGEGAPAGIIVNFACHPTTMTGNNWLYSADYPGYMVESLRKIYGPGCTPMFFNGACGDVTQVDYRRGFIDTFEECQRIGYMLGSAAADALLRAQEVRGGDVEVSRSMVPVKRITITPRQVAWAEAVMKRVEREGMPPLQADGMPDAVYARDWLELHKQQDTVDSLEVMAIRVGDAAIVAFPGEMFAALGMEVKSKSPAKHTFVVCLANDNCKYFPTRDAFTQGPDGFTPGITGYETTPGTTLYDIGAGEKLAGSALEQLDALFPRR